VKKVYQPIKFTAKDLTWGKFEAKNWLSFTNASAFDCEYTIFSAEKTLQKGKIDLDIEPFGTQQINIERLRIYGNAGEEFFIRFSVKLKKSQPFMPAGTEIAYDEFKLNWPSAEKTPMPKEHKISTKLTLDKGIGDGFVGNDQFQLSFDSETMEIKSYIVKGQELLKGNLKDNFWRAPTLNDEVDSWGLSRWKKADLQHLNPKTSSWHLDYLDENTVFLNATIEYYDSQEVLQFVVNKMYLINGEGNVSITNRVEPMSSVTTLPKVGMQFRMPLDYKNLTYFGKDTQNYPDRNASGKIGLYKMNALSLFEQHVVPQDNGNHSDTRWLALTSDNSQVGLFVTMQEPFHFSTYNYDDGNLTKARRINQLNPTDFLTVNVDYKQAGLGTATCGPDVDEKYRLGNQIYEYTVLLRAFDVKDEDPIELYRYQLPDVTEIMTPTPEIKAEMNGSVDFGLFNQPLTVTLTCSDKEAEIRYALADGHSEEKYVVYKQPFVIDGSCLLKVKAFKKGKECSFTAIRQFDFHPIKSTTFVNPPVERYGKNASIALMDGKKGLANDYYNDWLGFEGNDMEATIELTQPIDFNIVWIGFCHEPNNWVMWPKSVWVSFSSDGNHFSDWQMAELPVYDRPDRMTGHGRVEARARVNAKNINYIRVKVENQGTLPDWHPYAGQKAWIMVDEITVE